MIGILKKMFGTSSDGVFSPINGDIIPGSHIEDAVFANEILGPCVGIIPSEGKLYAPFDGVVIDIFKTKHALTLRSEQGLELLIHIGINTVELKGEPFTVLTKINDHFTHGQLLIEFDIPRIISLGKSPVTPVVILNSADYKKIIPHHEKNATTDTLILEVTK